MEWVEITHPFHPLRGHRFPMLKTRRISGAESLVLRGTSGGTFAVAREWTDRADPPLHILLDIAPPALCFERLVELVELLRELQSRNHASERRS